MPIGTDTRYAAELLRRGELVAIPTETVYGLAANAFDPDAVVKVFQAKQRPVFDPLIVHVPTVGLAQEVIDLQVLGPVVQEQVADLMGWLWPGPLTLVLPRAQQVPELVTSGLDTVAVRMPAHPMTLDLLGLLDFPLSAPSANPFGYVSPTTAQHVADQLGAKVAYILDGGPCSVGVESTIVGWEAAKARWVLHRPGGTPRGVIEAFVGPLGTPAPRDTPSAPGTLTSHYAPGKPMEVGDVPALMELHKGKRLGVISFTRAHGSVHDEVLAPSGTLAEAARHLFAALRRLDAADVELILAERFPDEGLGVAINDRLARASAKRE